MTKREEILGALLRAGATSEGAGTTCAAVATTTGFKPNTVYDALVALLGRGWVEMVSTREWGCPKRYWVTEAGVRVWQAALVRKGGAVALCACGDRDRHRPEDCPHRAPHWRVVTQEWAKNRMRALDAYVESATLGPIADAVAKGETVTSATSESLDNPGVITHHARPADALRAALDSAVDRSEGDLDEDGIP